MGHTGSRHTKSTHGRKQRQCLRCQRTFLSEGWHNRLCTPCKEHLAVSPTPEVEHRVVRD